MLHIYLNFANVGRVQDNVSAILPVHNAIIVRAPIKVTAHDKNVCIQGLAKFLQRRGSMLNGNLMHRIASRTWHVHRDQKAHRPSSNLVEFCLNNWTGIYLFMVIVLLVVELYD